MSTPCSQSLRPNRLVVSEYEVPNVLVSRKWGVYSETPGTREGLKREKSLWKNPCKHYL